MTKLLSDQENDVDRREDAFGKRAVGKCRDYKQNRQSVEQQTIQEKKLTGSSVSVSVSPAHAIPGVVQIAFSSLSHSLSSSPGVAPEFSLCLDARLSTAANILRLRFSDFDLASLGCAVGAGRGGVPRRGTAMLG